jgi:pyruvate kinase
MTNTQIVATIGPACQDTDMITQMVLAGMSMARLNFSWGTHEEHRAFVASIQTAAQTAGRSVMIVQDLSGPRVQQGVTHTVDTDIEVITEKDQSDIAALADMNIEYVALSFVKDAADITQLRTLLTAAGSQSKVIAKIERPEALANLDEIIAAADGIMIARGDLGDAIPFETLPFVKKDILKRCAQAQTPSIVATEMLTSMIATEKPSRADVSDIAHAVLDGASATMLSNETAAGKYPVKAVAVMKLVVDEAGKHVAVQPVQFH